MNDAIKQLLQVQEKDSQLDAIKTESAAIPAKVNALKADIQANKTALENAKKDLTQLQVAKKQKDIDLETFENAIRKHSGELNAVKTNEAYKALMGEIEKAKQEKSAVEDEVLGLMDKIDAANKVWKEKEASAQSIEDGFKKQISEWEAKQKTLEGSAESIRAERDTLATALSPKLREPYDRLRQNKRANAVVPIRNEQCTGCHMKVSQNLINELRRGQKLMPCESCARIVYLEQEPVSNEVSK